MILMISKNHNYCLPKTYYVSAIGLSTCTYIIAQILMTAS